MTDLQDPYGVDDDQATSPLRGRGFIMSTVLIVLVLFAGAVVVTLNVLDDDSKPSADPTETRSSTTAPDDAEASVCGLADVDLSGTLPAAPTDVEWEVDGLQVLPSSEKNGPGQREANGVRYCYARTPEGALLAAVHLSGAAGLPTRDHVLTQSDAADWIKRTIASGPGYDAALKRWPSRWAGITFDELSEVGGRAQVRGYRIATYDGSTALVDVAHVVTVDQDGSAQLRATRWELQWERGDWRARLAPDGSFPESTRLPDMTGFVPWSGA